jgi:hypothetical protein
MDVGTAVASAWSAGISMYGVLAFLGIAGRLEWISAPDALQEPWLIGVFTVLFVFELVVDKIAFLDSAWDGVHTFLRPVAGGYITAVAPEQDLPCGWRRSSAERSRSPPTRPRRRRAPS